MVIGRNGWFCTDPDCNQYCKQEGNERFHFIQSIWLDTCEGDTRAENAKDEDDNYAVCAGFIDLDMYDEETIECSLASYGYTLKSAKEFYGGDVNQVIAECLFEDNCLYDCNSIAGVVSKVDAEIIIQDYINRY